MGSYKNFIQDFPSRCNTLLNDFYTLAKLSDKEVTLVLTLATSGLIVPYERLKAGSTHPSSDRDTFVEAAQLLDDLEKKPFLGSELWDSDPGSWKHGKDVAITTTGVNVWALDGVAKPVGPKKQSKSVISALRNALAHGNIFSLGDPIDTLIFLAKPYSESSKFDFYMVSPNDFKQFLSKWFEFVESMHIPHHVPVEGTV
ncbi:MAG: hypothetical protein SVM79_02350 [Chloroflexota bacterium]|nr:hypothetical protein [Chloroflexota bacterium]